jgi:hypothetical protein
MLADARGRSVCRASLETGSADFFAPARAVRLGRLRDLCFFRLLRRGCAGACAAVFVVPILAACFGWGNWFPGPWVWVAEGAGAVAAVVGFWRAPSCWSAGPARWRSPTRRCGEGGQHGHQPADRRDGEHPEARVDYLLAAPGRR